MRQAIAGLVALLVAGVGPSDARSQSLSRAEREQTAEYAATRQNDDGGFAADPGGPSRLGSTTAAARILRYTGGSIPDVLGSIDFVRSCFDEDSGGFAQEPGGEPEVGSTASGLMALGELRIEDAEIIDAAVAYLSEHAETFPEVRIAVAGMEAVERTAPIFEEWAAGILDDRNADGTWGEGQGLAFDTGGTAVALLRMGVDFSDKEAVAAAVRDGQSPEGGWPGDDGGMDLSSSYRVMRCVFMMESQADLEAFRGFIGRCRRPDGGYAAGPDQGSSSLGATYMATIMLRWADLLENLPPVVETAGFVPLFNGRDLSGWEGDTSLWEARDGMLVGSSPGLDQNEFLATEGRYGDFTLKFSFRLDDGRGNSGVMFRSERAPEGSEMIGYQADIGEDYWGCLYDESRRNRVLVPASEDARAGVDEDGWNRYVIRAMGDRVRLVLNDVTSVDYVEEEAGIADDGKIAVQLHSGGPMEVRFRDLLIQPMPRPTAEGDDHEPGFHLRTLRGAEGSHRYAVFVPEGYDGQRRFPVVLFLHGAGERGEGGVRPAQVGLGPINAQRPGDFPFIAVFPQAQQTWSAESADAKIALAALDEVQQDYAVDPGRVVLTGLSMGGMGTWSIATAHPDRFSALVPICGPGDPEQAEAIKTIPTWGFVGDRDRALLVAGMRQMARRLQGLGAPVRYTEYRGVGHNSWDRAYSEPELVEWMLKPRRVSGSE